MQLKAKRYLQRKRRVRSRVAGSMERPRLSVYRSNKSLYAQIINDDKSVTLVAAKGAKNSGEKIGEELAKKAKALKIKKVVFDRNGFRFHGRVKALAEGARKGGLDF